MAAATGTAAGMDASKYAERKMALAGRTAVDVDPKVPLPPNRTCYLRSHNGFFLFDRMIP
jgi:hypothetical protein